MPGMLALPLQVLQPRHAEQRSPAGSVTRVRSCQREFDAALGLLAVTVILPLITRPAAVSCAARVPRGVSRMPAPDRQRDRPPARQRTKEDGEPEARARPLFIVGCGGLPCV
jgi:hypothetical protein